MPTITFMQNIDGEPDFAIEQRNPVANHIFRFMARQVLSLRHAPWLVPGRQVRLGAHSP
jgi:hypothetical protein